MRAYERLLKYVKYDTQSDPESETSPSAMKEFDLLKELKKELEEFGLEPELTDTGYVYVKIPGTVKSDVVGFLAHVDTAQECSGKDVNPRIVENWDGSDIRLNDQYATSLKQFPEMKRYIGKSLMVTDGTTLLGADDKAGVAEIMTAVKYMLDHPEFEHGDVYVAFTPDEEIGRGTENFEKEKFPCDYAYTMDGDAIGGVEYECFNAASLNITVTGYSIHPGSAKNKMINAMNIAHEYHSLLPKEMRPEHTEGREGFFHLDEMSGTVEEAKLGYIIRDHDYAKFMRMKKMALDAAEFINTKYGKKLVQAKIKDSYRNMADCFSDKMYIAEIAKEAWEECGVTPVSVPIRGGTDGASLTFMGIPCPNMGTGGGNFHGRFEYCCIDDMDVAVNAILKIVEKTAKRVK